MRVAQRRASVVFEAPHGPDAVEIWGGDVVKFGRSATCVIRFAHAPTADLFVQGVAGQLSLLGERVYVGSEAAGDRA